MYFLFFFFINEVSCDANVYRSYFSWKHLDTMTDSLSLELANFTDWNSTCDSFISNEGEIFAEIPPHCNISYESTINLPSNITHTELSAEFLGVNEADSESNVFCEFQLTDQDSYNITIGTSTNITLNAQLPKELNYVVRICNLENNAVQVLSPSLVLFRFEVVTDNSIIRQSTVPNHTKAIQFTITLNPSMGRIELETTRLRNAHSFPELFSPPNMKLENSNTEISMLPIIASQSRMIGFNILEPEILICWRIKEYKEDEEICLAITLEPKKTITLSYILIEMSSNNYFDALELWHKSFSNLYMAAISSNGAIAMPNPSGSIYCLTSFLQQYMWGNTTYDGFPSMLYYLPVEFNTITISLQPSELESCSISHPNITLRGICQYIIDNGVLDRNGNYIFTLNPELSVTYNIVWSEQFLELIFDYKSEFNSWSYTGYSHHFRETSIANYRNYDNIDYMLIDGNDRLRPTLSSTFDFIKSSFIENDTSSLSLKSNINNQNNIPSTLSKNLYIGDFFHPQFISTTDAYGILVTTIKQIDELHYFRIEKNVYNKIFSARKLFGSKPISLLETSTPTSLIAYVEDYLSLCLGAGVYPSFYFPVWGLLDTSCLLVYGLTERLNYYNDIMSLIFKNTLFYPNNNQVVLFEFNEGDQSPPNDPGSSYYESSTFCQNEESNLEGLIDCYTTIMLFTNISQLNSNIIKRSLNITFITEQTPICEFVSSDIYCMVMNQTVFISSNLSVSSSHTQNARTAVISFKYRVEQNIEDWVKENLGAIVGSLIGVLFLFVLMGFGIWFMYCNKKANPGYLERIIAEEECIRQEKQKRRLEINKEKEPIL